MKLFIGTSGYSYKEWKGSFYPKDLPAPKMLHYYGERFGTVEINSTFFALPKVATLEQWAIQVPDDFRFSFKAPKRITHAQPLVNKSDTVTRLCEILESLKERLGPILFQFAATFKKDATRLQSFLEVLPKDSRAAFEFRHPSWFR